MSTPCPDLTEKTAGRMERVTFEAAARERLPLWTPRDLAGAVFRHKALALNAFLGVLLGAILAALLLPEQYEARMKILVKRERVDPVVTPQANATPQISNTEAANEEDLNSEVELMTSRDLLEKVVKTCGLAARTHHFWDFLDTSAPDAAELRTARAVRSLDKDLKVSPARKSNLLEVTYASPDPALSARVLSTLANEYLVKHLAVHRPPGALTFFEQQAGQYRQKLAAAEARLADFSRDTEDGAVSPQMQRDLTLQRASEFEANLRRTEASIALTEERIRALEALTVGTPSRLTTTDRHTDNPQLLEQLKSSLLTMELKRTELRDKFEPTYRPLQELETQIQQARTAIVREEKTPLREQTTDRNPTYQWLEGELAKARADLATYRADAAATRDIVETYHQDALQLEQRDIEEQDLIREVKAEEANYLLYFNKSEEARISDALDAQRISNVAIAEAPTAPALPVHSRWLFAFLCIPFATLASLGSALIADHCDASIRTPAELEAVLNIPVLAAMPDRTT